MTVSAWTRRVVTATVLILLTVGIDPPSKASEPAKVGVAPVSVFTAAPTASHIDTILGLTTVRAQQFEATALLLVVVGMAIALVMVFGLYYVDTPVRTPRGLANRVRVPLLGQVPRVPKSPNLLENSTPELTDAYRALRTAVMSAVSDDSTRLLGVTSAQERDGAALTACNLAISIASTGSRVLVIDANLTHPRIDSVMQLHGRIGLFQVLAGQARIRDAVQRTSLANLSVMTAGRTTSNPSELFTSERMKQLIRTIKTAPFDWVIVAAPAVLDSDDSVVVAPMFDAVTIVLTERTRGTIAERAIERLDSNRVTVAGAILNNSAKPRPAYARYLQLALGRAS